MILKYTMHLLMLVRKTQSAFKQHPDKSTVHMLERQSSVKHSQYTTTFTNKAVSSDATTTRPANQPITDHQMVTANSSQQDLLTRIHTRVSHPHTLLSGRRRKQNLPKNRRRRSLPRNKRKNVSSAKELHGHTSSS